MNSTLENKKSLLSLFIFALPSMMMMLFSSLYVIVDGTFVSRVLGTLALSSVNMLYPVISMEMAVGIMIGSGGSAIIAKKLGEKNADAARADFTLLIVVTILVGIMVMLLGLLGIDPLLNFLGVSTSQADFCRAYGRVLLAFAPMFILQTVFQILFMTAGKPTLGLITSVLAGITNMALDYLFMVPLQMGIEGAAFATGIGYCIPAVFGLIYFSINQRGSLYFVKFRMDRTVIVNTCANGSSEMVTNISNAVTTLLFNYTFMRYWGESGVASITIIMYFQYIFTAIFFGYSNGVAPVLSYHFGGQNQKMLISVLRHSMIIIGISSIMSFALSLVLSDPVIRIFTSRSSEVYNLTSSGIHYYSAAFLLMGINIFASAFFTALSDGKTSALLSFSRTFLFLVPAIICLPLLFKGIGVWFAVLVAESFGGIVSIHFITKMIKKLKIQVMA